MSVSFDLVGIPLSDFVDYGCNQRWPCHRSQQISLHTFQPTHTPPHTLLCSYIKYVCAKGLGESICYISIIFSCLALSSWTTPRCKIHEDRTQATSAACGIYPLTTQSSQGVRSSSLPLQGKCTSRHCARTITHFTTTYCSK